MIKSKKGAIEMSMQTIIIVVIGVTLLTLGLRFVYTTFSGISSQQQGITELTNTQINELFGQSEEPIYLTKDSITIEQGETETVDVNVRNNDYDDGVFKYEVLVSDPGQMSAEQVQSWFSWSKNGRNLANGKGYSDKLIIRVPNNARTGSYLVDLNLNCPTEPSCAFTQLFITVAGS